MVEIKVSYEGYSKIPPFNYGVLKTETIEKSTLDEAINYLYEINNWNTENVDFDENDNSFATSILLDNTSFGDVVMAYYSVKGE